MFVLSCVTVWLHLESGSLDNMISTLAPRIGKQFLILPGLEADRHGGLCL